MGRVLLPFCPRLRRLILHRSCALGVPRWHKQVVGPRIPASWLHDVFDESWTLCLRSLWNPGGSQICEKHLKHLNLPMTIQTQSRSWNWHMVVSSSMRMCSALKRCSFLKDLCQTDPNLETCTSMTWYFFRCCTCHGCIICKNCPRAARAERMYRQLAMPISSDKGNALDGISGSLGFPMHRRTTLMYVTLLGALFGVTRGSLQQILGAWNFALSFQREALCFLDVAFMCARKLPTRRHTPAHGALLDDLLMVAGIGPLLQADLRTQLRYELFATDASPTGAGACVAKVTPDLWHSLYRIAEERGEHVRLDWGPAPPPPSLDSGGLGEALCLSFSNVRPHQCARARRLNFVVSKTLQGVRRQRILCCVDSRVV